MREAGALVLATYAGAAVYGSAIALGALFWLLTSVPFDVYLVFPSGVRPAHTVEQEIALAWPTFNTTSEMAPDVSDRRCGEEPFRVNVTTTSQIYNFPAIFRSLSDHGVSAGACKTGFALSTDAVQVSKLAAFGCLPVAAAILALLAYARRRADLWQRFAGWQPLTRSTPTKILIGSAAAVAMVLSQYLVFGVSDVLQLTYSGKGIAPPSAGTLLAVLPLTLVAAPLVEEYAFRGIVLERYLRALPPVAAVALGAVVFSLPHFPQTIVDFVAIIVLGLILGGTWLRTRSLLSVVWAHSVHNALATIAMVASG